jgi:hypothetical protein
VRALGDGVGQKSYRYEDDPVRAGNKALEENRLDDARSKFQEAVAASHQLPKAKFGLGEVNARTGGWKRPRRSIATRST